MVPEKIFIRTQSNFLEFQAISNFDRKVPCKPRAVRGVKGHNINDIALPGSPGLWPGSFIVSISGPILNE
jgi:hypothetical protein